MRDEWLKWGREGTVWLRLKIGLYGHSHSPDALALSALSGRSLGWLLLRCSFPEPVIHYIVQHDLAR
ncbi:MAG: hypothetical protein MnENMB40S_34470 [Rhizobiaceae bacterium MnEN-MB40S]|nr:MAG: hypothetical protein MnENMB40S_34470 [Rhizobiaceae bacterium MnEN-MB40S]